MREDLFYPRETDCEVHLKVDSAGLWLNGTLTQPFESFVDRLGQQELEFYRTRKLYELELQSGRSDKEALAKTTIEELKVMKAFWSTVRPLKGSEEVESAQEEIQAIPFISDFVGGARWDSKNGQETNLSVQSQNWVSPLWTNSSGLDIPNSRIWSEYLPNLIQEKCKLL